MIQASVLEEAEAEMDAPRLERLFDAHQRRLYRLARRLSSSREEAEDLVQEAFLRVAGALARVPAGDTVEEAWLVRVLVNLARDRWRRARVRSVVSVGRASRQSEGGSLTVGPASSVGRASRPSDDAASSVGRASRPSWADDPAGPSPESGYLARLAVQRALAGLAPRRRAVVVLHELEGLEAREIAALLGIASVTVRWHLSRARQELARILRTDGDV